MAFEKFTSADLSQIAREKSCVYLYIEDITRRREDMNIIFEWSKQYFTNERSE